MQTQSLALYKVKSPKISKKIFSKVRHISQNVQKNDYYDLLIAVVVWVGASLE